MSKPGSGVFTRRWKVGGGGDGDGEGDEVDGNVEDLDFDFDFDLVPDLDLTENATEDWRLLVNVIAEWVDVLIEELVAKPVGTLDILVMELLVSWLELDECFAVAVVTMKSRA